MNVELTRAVMDEGPGCVQSVVRAFGILNELSASGGSTLSEVADRLGLPRSTTHRLLSTMQALRYVRFDRQAMHWLIGIQAFNVGAAFTHASELHRRRASVDVRHSNPQLA